MIRAPGISRGDAGKKNEEHAYPEILTGQVYMFHGLGSSLLPTPSIPRMIRAITGNQNQTGSSKSNMGFLLKLGGLWPGLIPAKTFRCALVDDVPCIAKQFLMDVNSRGGALQP